MNKHFSFIIEENNTDKRLDICCAEAFPDLSREYIKRIIIDGGVLVNEQFKKASYKVCTGDQIEILVPEPEEYTVTAENIPLDIIYEDSDVLVVNKPKGMVVHPAPGNYSGTLVNALMHHTKDLSGINGVLRPGIIHRIDKDTTGLLMVAKNDLAHKALAEQLKVHTTDREYIGLVKGRLDQNEGMINMPIDRHPNDRLRRAVVQTGGKDAITHFHVIERFNQPYTLVGFKLETGRTHQIRVHMQSIGHPLAGDTLYHGEKGNPFKTEGQCLHAAKIGFIHPRTGEHMIFEAPLPDYLQKIILLLREEE